MIMEVLYERCAGLDIHKRTIAACVVVPGKGSQPSKEIRMFGTMSADLVALGDWLNERGVSHVAMEATGSFWHPIYNLLEDRFELLLANARHIKAVPGRKTDVHDCEWIADLLRHGLIRASFVPPRPQRELRELTRYRTSLIHERTRVAQRLQKTLEAANVKLASVAADILGKSGRDMLEALVAGTTDAHVLADLARGKMRAKLPELERALSGRFGPHQCFLVAQQLAHIDFLDEVIDRLSDEVAERLRPADEQIDRLDSIPGVGRRTAEILLAEIGTDVGRFPTAAHLASWAGMCPGNNESAGKRLSGKTRKGNTWVRVALIEAAQAAARKKDSYLSAQFRRLTARRGRKKAAVAVGHTILVIAYWLLTRPDLYHELGSTYFDERDRTRVQRRLVHRLEALGYSVELTPHAA
jgi:transposase